MGNTWPRYPSTVRYPKELDARRNIGAPTLLRRIRSSNSGLISKFIYTHIDNCMVMRSLKAINMRLPKSTLLAVRLKSFLVSLSSLAGKVASHRRSGFGALDILLRH